MYSTCFEKVVAHINRKRIKPEIKWIDKYTFEFTVETDRYKKYFRIHYQDSSTEEENASVWNDSTRYLYPRNRRQRYNVYFFQDLVPMRGNLGEVEGDRWFETEEETVEEIKRLCRNWRK